VFFFFFLKRIATGIFLGSKNKNNK